jgi:cell division protein FtsL
MIKLLICLVGATALAIAVLQLRQQNSEIGYQNADLHGQIRSHQARLWDQQLQIATFTAPNAISNVVKAHDLNMVPRLSTTTRPAEPAPATSPRRR